MSRRSVQANINIKMYSTKTPTGRGRGREEYFCFNLLKKNVANGKSTSMPSYIAWKNMNQKDHTRIMTPT
jgi:hypothetical protein